MGVLDGLRSLFGGGEAPPRMDDTFGDQDLAAARAQLLQGSWQEAEQLLAFSGKWDETTFRSRALAEIPGRSRALDAWVGARPGSASALAVRGLHLVKWAWDERGGGDADSVRKDSWDVFFDRLREAEEDFSRAEELDPADPTPLVGLLDTARGLQLGRPEIVSRFERGRARDPECLSAFARVLWVLCAKWQGSHEEMFTFAREASSRAPQGSRLHVLIPMAHVERWLFAAAFDRERSPDERISGADSAREIVKAARASVLRPGAVRTPATLEDRNWFAAALWKARRHSEAHAIFGEIGPFVAEIPWAWFGTPPERAFHEARRSCAAKTRS